MKPVNRVVSTLFWEDETIVNDFSPEDKLFYLYLLTNPHTTQLGIYRLVPKTAAFELGYSKESVMVLLDRFENKYDMIRYSKNTCEVAIKNFLKHSIVKGGKPVMDCLLKEEQQVEDMSLLEYIYNNLIQVNKLNNTVKEYIVHLQEILNDNDNERYVDESSTNRGRIVPSGSKKFIPPTEDDVEEYCIKKEYEYVYPLEFVSFYESKGWQVGSEKMISWHGAVAGWNSRSKNRGNSKNKALVRKIKERKEQEQLEQYAIAQGEWT